MTRALLALLICAAALLGQPTPAPSVKYVTTLPTGSCNYSYMAVKKADGTAVVCANAVWTSFGGGGSGSFVLVEKHTAASSAALNFTTCLSSTYDTYAVEVVNLRGDTSGDTFQIQVSTNGGASYDTGSNYIYQAQVFIPNGGSNFGGNPATSIQLFRNGTTQANWAIGGTIKIFGVGSGLFTQFTSLMTGADTVSDPRPIGELITGTYAQTTTINAFRIVMVNGNLASGNVRCYGLSK